MDDTAMARLDTADEVEVRLFDGSGLLMTWYCSPSELEDLAIGWLVGEGAVPDPSAVETLAISDPSTVRVTLSGTAAVGSHPDRPSAELAAWVANGEPFRALFEQMFDRSPSRSGGGGVHTGALVLGGNLVHVSEDVSRHCLVDKLIGRALRESYPAQETTILLSARISVAIAGKACRSGIGCVVSMSIPTTPAAELAARCGLILVGRARRPVPQVHQPIS